MSAHLRKLLSELSDTFWLVPGFMTLLGFMGGVGLVTVDRSGLVPGWLLASAWVYNGGGTGARTLLGVIAASTIGVAGTVFSITIAALSLAAAQMGPRLLRSFVQDRGVQFSLGAFLGTFAFALTVLSSVRTVEEGPFTPYLSLTTGVLLAFVCVGTLIYFVAHMAGRINVDTVIQLVGKDVKTAMDRLTTDTRGAAPPPAAYWRHATAVADPRQGYLQQIDAGGLADWATEHGTEIRLLVRPGDYVFPGAPIALLTTPVEGAEAAIGDATALGHARVSSADPVFAVRQLVEVAVRALSPGINDPYTAIRVLDELAATLCRLVPRFLRSGVLLREGKPALVIPSVDYDALADGMFHLIRQSADGSAAVLMHMLDVLSAVASCEHDAGRVATLERHAGLVLADAERDVATPGDLRDLRRRHAAFGQMKAFGPRGVLGALDA